MKILVAADDETGEIVVDELSKRAWSRNDEIRIVTVIDRSSKAFMEAERSDQPYLAERAVGELCASTAERLAQRFQKSSPDCAVSSCLLAGGAADAIVAEAEKWDPDLIAVGSHHKSGLTRVFEGSISEKIAKEIKCSLLIIPVRSNI